MRTAKKIPDPKTARETARLRQEDVASRAGISLRTVIRCEASGQYPRSLPMREAYLRAVGLAGVL